MESFNNLFESPLVSVDGFAKATKAILDEVRAELDAAPALDLADVNVDCDDLRYRSPKEQIQTAIDTAMADIGDNPPFTSRDKVDVKTVLERYHIPSYEELSRKKKEAPLHCIKHARWAAEQTRILQRKKEVNYLTENVNSHLDPEAPTEPVDSEDVVLSIALYHPSKNTKTQEYRVLGQQSLTALRDKLYCLSDHMLEGPKIKSGYFFVEHTFYNDMRHQPNADYSKTVIDWAEEMKRVTRVMRERHEAVVMKRPRGLTKQHAIGTYIITPASTLHAAVMEDTRFVDLNLRIGTPYLFCHQGNCLHHMIVHEVRRIDRSFDVLNRLAYPLHVFQSKIRRKKCRICDTCPAKYVTYGDKMSPENPCFYCDNCYRALHYDSEGRLLYSDYKVFPYYHE